MQNAKVDMWNVMAIVMAIHFRALVGLIVTVQYALLFALLFQLIVLGIVNKEQGNIQFSQFLSERKIITKFEHKMYM